MHTMFSFIGVKIPIKDDFYEMLIDYLTINKKYINQKSRQVFVSPLLQAKLENHPKRRIVGYIKYLLEEGRNVNIFQSKKLFQSKFHDHLLYEWSIYHFHLSNEFEKKKVFVKQTDQLLFAYIDDHQAIFLDLENHKPGIFAGEKWLEILDTYYPHILEKHHAKYIKDISPDLNSVERQTMWNKGYTIGMTKVNGKIIHSPGIGRTTSGHSLLVTILADNIMTWLFKINQQFKEIRLEICIEFNLRADADFKLRFGETALEIYEVKSKIIILTYPSYFDFKPNNLTYN